MVSDLCSKTGDCFGFGRGGLLFTGRGVLLVGRLGRSACDGGLFASPLSSPRPRLGVRFAALIGRSLEGIGFFSLLGDILGGRLFRGGTMRGRMNFSHPIRIPIDRTRNTM